MQSDSKNTNEYLASIPAWQSQNLQAFRELIHQTCSDISEEIKWGVPVFIYKSKTVFAMASFKEHTKYNFILNGALLDDTNKLFNNGMESKKSRAIDLQEGQVVDKNQLKNLIGQAIELV